MKSARTEALADMLAKIATRLEQAEDVARRKAAESLPRDMAFGDREQPRLPEGAVVRMRGPVGVRWA